MTEAYLFGLMIGFLGGYLCRASVQDVHDKHAEQQKNLNKDAE